MLVALLLVALTSWLFRPVSAHMADRTFRRLQLVSAASYSLGHGANDAQKTMGIIAVLLYLAGHARGRLPRPLLGGDLGAAGDGARHPDGRLADRPHDGIEDHPADPAPGILRRDRRRDHAVFGATWLGIPVSTTHTITGCIMGVGAARRASAVRWGVAGNIVFAWIVTMPAAALIAAGFYGLTRLF